ncbi:MAG: peptidylprolyl isomerase [bacterium]|nr:peptidylprolyl isomerase [bacterium]
MIERIHVQILLVGTLVFSIFLSDNFAARVQFFKGKVLWGDVMTKDGLISVNSENGLFQYKFSTVKTIKAGRREHIVVGSFVELKKEPSHTSDVHFRLYEGTTLRKAGAQRGDFHKVRVFDTIGWVADKSVGRILEQTAGIFPLVELTTKKGLIGIELFEDECPNTVANFVNLADKQFYNGLEFHRVDENFLVMGGDPEGTGEGGPGYYVRSEFSPNLKNLKGVIGMADSGINTAGSQFYFLLSDAPHLDGRYTVFGRVYKGMEVIEKLSIGDEIVDLKVVKRRDKDYKPEIIPINSSASK